MSQQSNAAEIIQEKESTGREPIQSLERPAKTSGAPGPKNRIISQFYEAILDPRALSLQEWVGIQESIREIEKLAPHIELIVRLRRGRES